MSDNNQAVSMGLLFPASILFPLFCIGFGGCFDNGCQGALNAQSKAVHQAYLAGGWEREDVRDQ